MSVMYAGPFPPVVTAYMATFPEIDPWNPGTIPLVTIDRTTVMHPLTVAPLTEAEIRRIIHEELKRMDRKTRKRAKRAATP